MLAIKKRVLEEILLLCKQAYPYEIGGLLLNNPVDDIVLLPGKYTRDSVIFQFYNLPIYPSKIGTFHSHPSGSAIPSRNDREVFPKLGPYHLIIAFPYTTESIRAYNAHAQEVGWEII